MCGRVGRRNVRRKRDGFWVVVVAVCRVSRVSRERSDSRRFKARRFASLSDRKRREILVIAYGDGAILGSMSVFATAMTSVVENSRAENLVIDLGEMR